MKKELSLKYLEKNRFKISALLIWSFTLITIIGVSLGYQNWFASLTPISLSILLLLILWQDNFRKEVFLILSVPFLIGMIVEYLGVNYGFIFGDYYYGNNLGMKIFGVPIMMGINWAILIFISAAISKLISNSYLLSSMAGALLMTSLDILIEVSSEKFDYRVFRMGFAPIQNYIGWFAVAFITHLIFQKILKKDYFMISFHIFTAITILFSVFILF
ncbi:carotenoid biosynthesis protein [Flavobacteriaceae bacterium R38]|nr:carotenoid biosynthesis protein [Flavobacteriaceae bacterium R38]